MRKLFITAALFISSFSLFATIRTVNNQGGAQFTDIGSAITAASSGDTIYIHGSSAYYCIPSTVKDNLTFIGPGFNPQKQVPNIANITCGLWPVGDNNTFIGLEIQGFMSNPNCNYCRMESLTVKRCRVYGNLTAGCAYFSNILYENCVFMNMALFTSNGNCGPAAPIYSATIRNCIFYNSVLWANVSYVINVLVDHNVFISTGGGSVISTLANPQASFTNNIFNNCTATVSGGGGGLTYNNNFSTTQNLNINSGTGNLQGANPQFVNYPGGAFTYSHDYHLAAGSPCIGTGTGGGDMGVYAGLTPFFADGTPPIPQISLFNILGTQVPSGGAVNIQFQSKVHQ